MRKIKMKKTINSVKLYDVIKRILINDFHTRSSDKILIWEVWQEQLIIKQGQISFLDFKDWAVTPESITRSRRRIQQDYPELQANREVLDARRRKEASKGTFIFKEEL